MNYFTNNYKKSASKNNEGGNTVNNRYFDLDVDVNNPAPRCPVILLLDTSFSMEGEPINELNQGVRQFICETAYDEAASMSVELEIITFNNKADIVMPFTPIYNVDKNPPPLTVDGCTHLGEALDLAAKELDKRRQTYQNNGIPYYNPWVILMTDGRPTDDWQAPAGRLKKMADDKDITYLGIEIGSKVDHGIMLQLMPSRNPKIATLDKLEFKKFFRWLTSSMSTLANSAVADQDDLQFDDISSWGTWHKLYNR